MYNWLAQMEEMMSVNRCTASHKPSGPSNRACYSSVSKDSVAGSNEHDSKGTTTDEDSENELAPKRRESKKSLQQCPASLTEVVN